MSDSKYPNQGNKSKLKLARLPVQPVVTLRLGGMEPSDDMQPAEYKVACEGAVKSRLVTVASLSRCIIALSKASTPERL